MEKEREEAAEAIAKEFGVEASRVYVCMADDMHPYNCDGMFGGSCIHCEEKRTEEHDPANCALCKWDEQPT